MSSRAEIISPQDAYLRTSTYRTSSHIPCPSR